MTTDRIKLSAIALAAAAVISLAACAKDDSKGIPDKTDQTTDTKFDTVSASDHSGADDVYPVMRAHYKVANRMDSTAPYG